MGCSQAPFRPQPEPLPFELEPPASSASSELRRLLAFPLVYLAAWTFSATGAGQFVLRTFFGMWLHELGHASAAWLTGRWALPMPWVTFSFDRSWLVTFFMVAGGLAVVRLGMTRRSFGLHALGGAVLVATLVGHLLPDRAQQTFDVFGGEAGAMVLGATLSCGFLVRGSSRLFRGGLRWGWLVIGAASWADATRVWWAARLDPAEIPFGVEDGMASDASRLVDDFGWDAMTMVKRFLAVAVAALLLALGSWLVALWRARATERR